jgi:plastocyanin
MRPRLAVTAVAPLAILALAPAPLARAAGQTHRIDMKGVAYVPAQIKVHVGDTVEWRNSDMVAHTATGKEAGFEVDLSPGSVGRVGMNRAGTFGYICRYHPNMKGEIVVEP